MIPLALSAADTHHSDTAGFILSVPSDSPRLPREQPRARGSFFDEVTHGEG